MYGVLGTLEGKKSLGLRPGEGVRKPQKKRRCQRCGLWCRDWCTKTNKTLLVLGAILGLPAFYMTLWLLLSPGLSTLAAHFHPASCTVASSTILEGNTNCTWSSCRQGCTASELYLCWQVLVFVQASYGNHSTLGQVHGNLSDLRPLPAHFTSLTLTRNQSEEEQVKGEERNLTFSPVPSPTQPDNINPTETDAEITVDELSFDEMGFLLPKGPGALTRLQVNAEGCGYESCEEWYRRFGHLGSSYTCYLSADGSMAVPEVDLEEAKTKVALGMLPLMFMTVAIVVLYVLYCPRKPKKRHHSTKQQELKWEQARHLILREVDKKNGNHQHFDPILVKAALMKNQVAPSNMEVKKGKKR